MRLFFTISIFLLIFTGISWASDGKILSATPVDQPPTIDGIATEPIWASATPTVVHDEQANIDIELKACYDQQHIYVLVTFPDPTEDRLHRALVWNSASNRYNDGPSREDVLVLKWNMSPYNNDLSLTSDRPYRADIWFWKASRTDHAGYADDKIQYYTSTRSKQSRQLISASGKVFYLRREADSGESAYIPKLETEYAGDIIAKYHQAQPTGSRADVRAKGQWRDGVWSIEFSRLLDTGHGDDLQMSPTKTYTFGVSRFEIAGRNPEPKSQQPLYGCGDATEAIALTFK